MLKVREKHLNNKALNPWSINIFMLMAYMNNPYLCPLFMLICLVWGRAFKIATYIRFMGLQAVDVNAWWASFPYYSVWSKETQNIVGRCYLWQQVYTMAILNFV